MFFCSFLSDFCLHGEDHSRILQCRWEHYVEFPFCPSGGMEVNVNVISNREGLWPKYGIEAMMGQNTLKSKYSFPTFSEISYLINTFSGPAKVQY
jgi:hypothetical protein